MQPVMLWLISSSCKMHRLLTIKNIAHYKILFMKKWFFLTQELCNLRNFVIAGTLLLGTLWLGTLWLRPLWWGTYVHLVSFFNSTQYSKQNISITANGTKCRKNLGFNRPVPDSFKNWKMLQLIRMSLLKYLASHHYKRCGKPVTLKYLASWADKGEIETHWRSKYHILIPKSCIAKNKT